MSDQGNMIGMFLIGIGLGLVIPKLPAPLDVASQYLWLALLVAGVFVMVWKK